MTGRPEVSPQARSTAPLHVVVIGGGVAGLSTAWRLLADPELAGLTPTCAEDPGLAGAALDQVRSNLRVTVVESQDRLGGNIRSERDRGFLVEWGPNGYLDNAPETPRLCRLLGIEHRILPARDAASRRFLFVRGRLRELPLSPGAFLSSSVLTPAGRLRVLCEPFIPARPDPEESVYSFAARRIGDEAARTLVDAMVSGVYGGSARELSLLAAFPRMHALEKEYGGLVRGMMGKMREKRRQQNGSRPKGKKRGSSAGPAGPGGVLTSFDEGFEVLITELARSLRATGRCEILLGSPADGLTPPASPADALTPPGSSPTPEPAVPNHREGGPWRVHLGDGRELAADAVLLAIPSRHAGALTRSFDTKFCEELQGIPEAPLIVVGLGYRTEDLPSALDGFGFLIPRGEGPRCLGVLWDSCIYPNRAPEGMVLMRAMLGGAHDRSAIDLEDAKVLSTVLEDLKRTMGVSRPPRETWILRHKHGIPQYVVGHPERLRRIEERRRARPGLYLAGNSYRGISVNHCVEQSLPLAREILHRWTPAVHSDLKTS